MIPIDSKNAAEVAKTVKDTPISSPGSVRRSLGIQQLAAAMVAVQKQIEDPTKNKSAARGEKGGSYRYADLPTVLDAVRPALVANGFAVMQFPCELDDAPALTTILLHTSGEWVETTTKIRPVNPSPQNVGSALTYARRYALLALCGIAADDDDDGRAASQAKPAQQQQKPPGAAPVAVIGARAKTLITRLGAATSREEGESLWRQYEFALKDATMDFSGTDKVAIDAAFKAFGQRWPKPAEQPAAK